MIDNNKYANDLKKTYRYRIQLAIIHVDSSWLIFCARISLFPIRPAYKMLIIVYRTCEMSNCWHSHWSASVWPNTRSIGSWHKCNINEYHRAITDELVPLMHPLQNLMSCFLFISRFLWLDYNQIVFHKFISHLSRKIGE